MGAAVLPAVLVDLTNDARASNNAGSLARSTVLDQAAQLKADDMARFGYFAHTSPAGITPWYWFNKAGYSFAYAGENLAIDFTESVTLEDAWLKSPTHKANILNDHFTEIGIATVDGMYQGHSTTYVVQMFGQPAKVPVSATIKTATPVTTPTETKNTKPEIKLPTPSIALAPVVKGESATTDQNLETVIDTPEFISVKNNEAEEKAENAPTSASPRYSSWSDRSLFLTPTYVDRIYRIFMWVVLVALLGMTIIEMSRRHRKNIMYGILLLAIMLSLVYINKTMFVTSLLV